MFIPLFIAILLGLVNPNHTNSNCNGGSTVQINSTDPANSEGEGGGDDGGTGTDSGTDGPGHGGPGGNTGQNPPKP